MDGSYTFFDATYASFADTTSTVDYAPKLFDFCESNTSVATTTTNDPFSLGSTPYDPSLLNLSAPYDLNDLIPPIDFQDFLVDDWAGGFLNFNGPSAEAPTHLATSPHSLPSTPKASQKPPSPEVSDIGLLSPPPSDRPPHRTRRYNKYEDIYHLAQLTIHAPAPVEQTVDPAAILPPPASIVEPSDVQPASYSYNAVCPSVFDTPRLLYPPSDSEMGSPSVPSSSRGSPSPERQQSYSARPTRASGVQRVIVSDIRRARQGNQPVSTGDPERPHGCRHPGRFPGDLPCNLDFARKHDWSRHQRVHTGETPYSCRGCDRPFKRPDARGRHWDSRPECEVAHTAIVRDLLLNGDMSTDDRDVPVLRRRAQKAECRRESERTGVPVKDLKSMMRQVKTECVDGPGF